MPVIGTLARDVFFLAGFPWDHHDASVFDAALGDDVIGEMLYLGTGAAQRGHLHAVIIVEVNMKRGERQIVMAMIIFDQPPRQVARSMIVNVDQRRDAGQAMLHPTRDKNWHTGYDDVNKSSYFFVARVCSPRKEPCNASQLRLMTN